MHGANSSDRETNGRVSGREGDLGGGLRPAAPSFWGAGDEELRNRHARVSLTRELAGYAVREGGGCDPTREGWGVRGPGCAARGWFGPPVDRDRRVDSGRENVPGGRLDGTPQNDV